VKDKTVKLAISFSFFVALEPLTARRHTPPPTMAKVANKIKPRTRQQRTVDNVVYRLTMSE